MEKLFDINNLEEQEVFKLLLNSKCLYDNYLENFKKLLFQFTEQEITVNETPYICLGNNKFIVEISKESIKFFESMDIDNNSTKYNEGVLENNKLVFRTGEI